MSTTLEENSTLIGEAQALAETLPDAGSGTDISLGVTGAAVGDIIKVKAVDASGKPTAWEAATAKLANPNALTFTGAVTGSYDGSAPLSVEIPSGGGGITVTNTAAVGQTVKITAVDENGQPTKWEAVDMVSGGADAGNLLYDVVLDADSTIEITDFDTDLGEYLVIIGTVVPDKGIVSNVKLFNTMGSDYYLKINAGFAVLSIYYRIIGNVFWMVRDVNYRDNTDFANITEPPGTPSSHSNANIRSGAYKFGEKTSGLKSSTIWPTGTHVWIYGR